MSPIQLSKKQFDDIKRLVYRASGIHLHDGKRDLLISRISKRMHVTQMEFADYLTHLETDQSEVIEFIDTITTNPTAFYRENSTIAPILDHFSALPDQKERRLKIWCSACSTGEEPYGMAIQMKEAGLSFIILASDISRSVLNTATQGIYTMERLRKLSPALVQKYFQRGDGKYQGHVRIKKEIRNHIQFRKFNLVKDPVPVNQFDVVLCRNVLIYFDPETSEQVVTKLYNSLTHKGFFAIGKGETLNNLYHEFKPVAQTPGLYTK